jgi:PRTRC genetic system protein A
MFRIFVNDGSQEMPDDDILYIVSKEGVYLKKKLGIMESITPVKNISILKSIEMMATMHIKPIPGTLFAPVIDFFKKVYKEYYGEAIVLLFYNEEKRTYKIVPPAQKVSAAGVDYNRAMTLEGYIMVGDIHSHANFSAFHSGVDDKDEESFDGLHITIGNNNDDEVSISTSIVSNGQRFIADTLDYVNGLALTVDIDEVVEQPLTQYYVYDQKLKKMVPKSSSKTTKVKRFDKRYVSTVSKKYQKCPDEWMDLVEKRTFVYRNPYSYWDGWNNTGAWNKWDTNKFDQGIWGNWKKDKPLLPVQATQRAMFPPHPQKYSGPLETPIASDKTSPCEKCAFQDQMLEFASKYLSTLGVEDYDEDELSKYIDDEGNPIDWYECDECDEIFSTTEEMPVCPKCNVDDHLILLDAEDIEFVSKEDEDGPWWYQCNNCKQVFDTMEDNPICENCQSDDHLVQLHMEGDPTPYVPPEEPFTYKCKACASEINVLNHGKCPFCGGDVIDMIDMEAALAAAEEADETLEATPLQIPDEDRIPLGTRKKEKRKPGVFASLFNRRNKQS